MRNMAVFSVKGRQQVASSRESELLRQQDVLATFGERALKSEDLDDLLHEACNWWAKRSGLTSPR